MNKPFTFLLNFKYFTFKQVYMASGYYIEQRNSRNCLYDSDQNKADKERGSTPSTWIRQQEATSLDIL